MLLLIHDPVQMYDWNAAGAKSKKPSLNLQATSGNRKTLRCDDFFCEIASRGT